MDTEKIKRMKACCYLLPEPGDQVVSECLDEIIRLREGIESFLASNDPEGFGCACTPTNKCGPCLAYDRQKVLRELLK